MSRPLRWRPVRLSPIARTCERLIDRVQSVSTSRSGQELIARSACRTRKRGPLTAPRVTSPCVRPFDRAAAAAALLGCVLAACGCGAFGAWAPAPAPSPRPAAAGDVSADSAPQMGLTSEDDFVVRVVSGAVSCSGALIAEDRVLTAHHCVIAPRTRGEEDPRRVPPEAVRVELGGDHLPWAEIGVRWIVTPSCGQNGGDGDIAILVLARRLPGVATGAAELDAVPKLGNSLIAIGFGRCADEGNGIVRRRRSGSSVSRVMDRRFQLQAAICPGDSGGPGIDPKTGRIVGVVSASDMDSDEATPGLSEFTRLDQYRPVFAAAAQIAAGAIPAELPPIDCRR